MAEETLLNTDKDAVMRSARAVLKEPLQHAIDVFAQQVSEAFSVDESAHIMWRHGEESFPIARLVKSADFYQPTIQLLHTDLLEDAQNKIILTRLESWWQEQAQKHLGALLTLKDAEITGIGKGIAFQLYEHTGIMLRSAVQEMITTLPKEERPALNKIGVRLGAYYIYQRDMLKPAALHMKAVLWRLFHGVSAENTPLPQSGNVSMACPENGNRNFYSAIGFPVFGKTCVRVDMVERLNSAIFDGAVEGKYKFDPALASTVGVGVDTVQFILHDLGFRFEETTEIAEPTEEGAEAVTTTTRFYHVKKRPPRLETSRQENAAPKERAAKSDNKGKFDKNRKPANGKKHGHAPTQKAPSLPASKGTTGYNAFAELAAFQLTKK